MIIKFSDKFDSLFHAVLYSNLTGYYLSSKNEPQTLFENEQTIDIDKLNWQHIIEQHDENFGPIKWLNDKDEKYLKFKKDIEFALRYWKPFKYRIIIDAIRQTLKFGLSFFEYKASDQITEMYNIIKQVKIEIKCKWLY